MDCLGRTPGLVPGGEGRKGLFACCWGWRCVESQQASGPPSATPNFRPPAGQSSQKGIKELLSTRTTRICLPMECSRCSSARTPSMLNRAAGYYPCKAPFFPSLIFLLLPPVPSPYSVPLLRSTPYTHDSLLRSLYYSVPQVQHLRGKKSQG